MKPHTTDNFIQFFSLSLDEIPLEWVKMMLDLKISHFRGTFFLSVVRPRATVVIQKFNLSYALGQLINIPGSVCRERQKSQETWKKIDLTLVFFFFYAVFFTLRRWHRLRTSSLMEKEKFSLTKIDFNFQSDSGITRWMSGTLVDSLIAHTLRFGSLRDKLRTRRRKTRINFISTHKLSLKMSSNS